VTLFRELKSARNRGLLVTLEGPDGAGKSTQLGFVARHLASRGLAVRTTREPGGTDTGERIRELVLHGTGGMSPDTELMLIFAARRQHLEELIVPALNAGTWIVCDRFTDATYAYQGGGSGIAETRIAIVEQWVQEGIQPDMTFLLDVPVLEGLQRTLGRGRDDDRFEKEDIAFKERVRQAYLTRAARFPDRIHVVDARPDIERVSDRIAAIVDSLLETRV
jgi:dTMP kinase